MAANARVKGLRELLQKFAYLGEFSTIERISYRATFGAAKDVREAARANSENSVGTITGALHRGWAIKKITIGSKRGYTVGVRHGPKQAKKRGGDDPFYWWFLELGTVHIAPYRFLTRALESLKSKSGADIQAKALKAVLDSGDAALRKFGRGV